MGFMWIGTKGGLDRFDGVAFKNFILDPQKAGANNVTSLRQDGMGRIWIGTHAGLFRYDPRLGCSEQVPQAPHLRIADIRIDKAGNTWFIAGGRLYRYDEEAARAIALNLQCSALEIDAQGTVWIGTPQGVVKRVDAGSHQATPLVRSGPAAANRALVTRIAAVDSTLIVGTTKGFYRLDSHTGYAHTLLNTTSTGADVFVRDVQFAEQERKYYIATESGLFSYDSRDGGITSMGKTSGDPYALNDNALYTICVDNRNGLWVGTFFGGINYHSPENSHFEKYGPTSATGSISGNAVREISGDGLGNVWVGTEDAGITRLNPRDGTSAHLAFGDSRTGFSYPNIHGLAVDDTYLYVGPFVHGFEVMELSSGKIIQRFPVIRADDGLSSSNFVMSIHKTRAGQILVGTTGAGLHRYDPASKTLSQVKEIRQNSYVYAIYEDHAGTIWTGSLSSGVFHYNPRTGKYGNISFGTDLSDQRFYTIQGIHEDRDHALWLTSEGGGLIRLDSSRTQFRRYTKADGLPTEYTYRILEDASGHLWISSLKGLIHFDPKNEKFRVFTQANGLTTDQFNYSSAYQDPDGKLYFGTVKGMIAFRPENLEGIQSPPPLYLTALRVGNTRVSPDDGSAILRQSTLFTDSITLGYRHASFELAFAALDFAAPTAIRYRYRMVGFDDSWTQLATNRNAYYTGLPAGTYRFVVQATSNVGRWETEARTVVVTVLPPPWKSWPAYMAYALASALAIAAIGYYYHRNTKRRNARKLQLYELEMEKEAYQSKIEFFTHIAHEIRTPLTLIKGPVEWAHDKAHDQVAVRRNLRLVRKYTDRLVDLTTQLLDFRKAETDQFTLNFVATPVNPLIGELVGDFTPAAEKRGLQLRCFDPGHPIVAAIDREAFIKIVGNLLSNAVKYAERYISIEFEFDGEGRRFSVTVANDGPPIPPVYREKIFEPFFRIPGRDEAQGTGIGLSLARSLAALHHGELRLIADEAGLNVFQLVLPIDQQAAFKPGPETITLKP